MLCWGIGESPASTGHKEVLFARSWIEFSAVKWATKLHIETFIYFDLTDKQLHSSFMIHQIGQFLSLSIAFLFKAMPS